MGGRGAASGGVRAADATAAAAGLASADPAAVGAIGDHRAVDGLIGALGDCTSGVRKQAAWALGAIGG